MVRVSGSVLLPALVLAAVAPASAVTLSLRSAHRSKPGWKHRLHIYQRFINRTLPTVSQWSVVPTPAKETDKVAVTILQPATPEHIAQFAYVIRSNLHRLGPGWALQVFYGAEDERAALSEALGNPDDVIWSPIVLQGKRRESLDHAECSWFRLSTGFWGHMHPEHEHVLVFESDSLLRKRGCVEEYIDKGYDYVGAPWGLGAKWGPPAVGGNGGFSLRRLSTILAAVKSTEMSELRGDSPELFTENEDSTLVKLLLTRNASFPTRESARNFAVETVFHPTPCAFHKPWANLGEDAVGTLMKGIDMD